MHVRPWALFLISMACRTYKLPLKCASFSGWRAASTCCNGFSVAYGRPTASRAIFPTVAVCVLLHGSKCVAVFVTFCTPCARVCVSVCLCVGVCVPGDAGGKATRLQLCYRPTFRRCPFVPLPFALSLPPLPLPRSGSSVKLLQMEKRDAGLSAVERWYATCRQGLLGVLFVMANDTSEKRWRAWFLAIFEMLQARVCARACVGFGAVGSSCALSSLNCRCVCLGGGRGTVSERGTGWVAGGSICVGSLLK
jgi:hypothetical protein